MWGWQAAKYVCAANLMRTFEKAKSQRERRCLGSPHSKQPELRLACVFVFPSESRTNNYAGKFCMLHLIDVAGRKIPSTPPQRKCWNICHVGCQSCCLAQPNCCHGFSISAFSGSLKVAVGRMCVDTIATIFFTVTVYSEAENDI